MKQFIRFPVWLVLACAGWEVACGQGVVINEIMYHPSSEMVQHEFVELHNLGPTNVTLTGWRISAGVDYAFPSNQTIAAGGYLVVAADVAAFQLRYPGVSPVVGGWDGILSNSRNSIELENAAGDQVDRVTYADEGDWATRVLRPDPRAGRLGWEWEALADGLGSSLELINPAMPNEHGQNWAASTTPQGTPGAANSVQSSNIAPLVFNVTHFPIIPTSSDNVTVTCRIVDEEPASSVAVRLHWRVDGSSPPPFNVVSMRDDGQSGDGVAGDGLFGVRLGPFTINAVIEFYVEAEDTGGRIRTWPAAGRLNTGDYAQDANALLQVDNNAYTGQAPLLKLIMTVAQYQALSTLFNSYPQSDAQVNATFIAQEATGLELRYLVGVRNRGHGSRSGTPHNYRINFRSDESWMEATAINLNARRPYSQHLGAVLAQKAGADGANSRAVQLRVNNGPGPGGTPEYGHYAANEAVDSRWADNHYPNDGGGNVYKVIRDINPPNFDYRGDEPAAYFNTYFKQSNQSENDWSDLIQMLRVMGENSTVFSTETARSVAHVEQWLTHLAVMSLFGNYESGLNTGNNDDYYLYSGGRDRRFILIYHDLDQIMGFSSQSATESIFRAATCCGISGQSEGSWRAMSQLMRWPDFEPVYYATLQRLIDTVFSAEQFDPLVDQVLGHYVPQNTRDTFKNWMNQRRASVQSQIDGQVPPAVAHATVSGEPRSPTRMTSVTLKVGGADVVAYHYKLNNGIYSQETPVDQLIRLTNLPEGSTNTVYVLGKSSAGLVQDYRTPTVSRTWVVSAATPYVRLNEVLASNHTVTNHYGTYPDLIELFNEFVTALDLGGMSLTDDPKNPAKFIFPPGTMIGPRQYMVLYANDPDGTPGVHLGFALDQTGEGVYLYDAQGQLADSMQFGNQVADWSVGRIGLQGAWELNTPTFGAANLPAATGDPSALRINEWLAAGSSPFYDDYVELYNPGPFPVDLVGLYLTDNPIGDPLRQRFGEATFVPAGGYTSFIADGNGSKPGHVDFRLASALGQIALLDQNKAIIDHVMYGPQEIGVSEGLCPNGGTLIQPQAFPTPGAANACPSVPPEPITVSLVARDQVWRYEQSGIDLGTAWTTPGYDDSGWPSGPAILGVETCNCTPDPIRTPLVWLSPQQSAFYFRTTFNVPADVTIDALQLEYAIDDGAVFYLNGQEVFRYNLPGGDITYDSRPPTAVGDASSYLGPVTLPLGLLQPGVNHMAVRVHQAIIYQNADIVFGMRMYGVIVTNPPVESGVVLNELLASNATVVRDPDGATPDLAEIYNPSNRTVTVAGLSLSDGLTAPRQVWTFPPGSILAPYEHLTIRFDPDRAVSATNTGFALPASGGSLYLLEGPTSGAAVVDVVHFGLQTPDFSIGRLPDGNGSWALTLPTFGSANLVAPLGNSATVRINEWMAGPVSGDDWFELYNPNDLPVAIGGYFLTDNLEAYDKSPIPGLSFIGGVTNGWQKFVADGNVDAGADHVNFGLKMDGETLGFYAPNGELIDAQPLNNQAEGVSEGRLPDGSGNIVRFPDTESPGDRNYVALTDVVVNEVLSHSDPPLEDAIELFNPTDTTIDIGGWWLSDAKSTLFKYQIPAGTQLPAGGYHVVYENHLNNGDLARIPFALSSAKGDEVYLTAAPNGLPNGFRHTVEFGPAANGVSFGRYATSVDVDFVAMSQRTFGVDTPPFTLEQFRTGQGLANAPPLVGPIVFTEIMYHPQDLGTNDNVRDEFVELHNLTPDPIPLFDVAFPANTWRLRKGIDLDFPTGAIMPANGYVLAVSFNPDTDLAARTAFEARYGTNLLLFGPYSGKLDNGGEAIELQRPDTPQLVPGPDYGLVPYIVVERIRYRDDAPWPAGGDGDGLSLQRIASDLHGNDPVNWHAAVPTPEPASSGLVDSDGDGMPDSWELANGLNPNQHDANDDPDGDGMKNLDEYEAGTDPQDPNSLLRIVLGGVTGGQATLRFVAMPDKTYAVLYRESLDAGNWLTLTNVPAQPVSQEIMVVDPGAGTMEQRFYQLVTPARP
jgi:hypothetical protein